uniref:Uncharacterized protein n=1 Tax=Cacopsylla melanoneura TaxID=428564 RepID=A0A8D8SGY1_9HEMI
MAHCFRERQDFKETVKTDADLQNGGKKTPQKTIDVISPGFRTRYLWLLNLLPTFKSLALAVLEISCLQTHRHTDTQMANGRNQLFWRPEALNLSKFLKIWTGQMSSHYITFLIYLNTGCFRSKWATGGGLEAM